MPKGVYTSIDSTFKWGLRDMRPPASWSAADRTRRFDLAIISPRWSDTLNNPFGIERAVPGCRNLIDLGCFYLTYATDNVNAPGTFLFNVGAPPPTPAPAPIFTSQDGCPSPFYDAFPVGDDLRDWKDYVIANGLHDFSDDLASELVDGNNQGWYGEAPYHALRIDETSVGNFGSGNKLFQPLWAVNFHKPNSGVLFANYVLANYGAFDGINFEYWEPPDWYKNWGNSTYWLTFLNSTQRAAYSAQWRANVQAGVDILRAAGKIVIGQQVPSGTSAYDACVMGMFRENNPTAFINPKTRATCIANDAQHKASIAAADPTREYISGWHVWHPYWQAGLNYWDERLGRATANQTEHDSLIEWWKGIASATPGALMFIGDGGNDAGLGGGYDMPWEGPPTQVKKNSVRVPRKQQTLYSTSRVGPSSLDVSRKSAVRATAQRTLASRTDVSRIPATTIPLNEDKAGGS